MTSAPRIPSPGARVVIRDAEWIVRRVDNASDGGWRLTCDGVSDIVRGKTGLFLTALEEDIEVLDPAETQLVVDDSPRYAASLLYLESHLRSGVPNDDRIHLGHRGAMDFVPYQLDPAIQALRQHRQRILIADATGLGKTLEAGILVTELIQRGRGNRILVVALKSMLTQFQKEFWNRFTIPLVRLDSVGLARVRSRIPANHNPFYYYDKTIISIDTLKGDLEYRNYLESAWWDIIIIDECQNVADRGTGSQRSRLARQLASRSDTLIMLSATPHDGRARSFASLVNMLDPTAISDPDEYAKEDFRDKGLVIRRFKKDIQQQVGTAFKEREVRCDRVQASAAEEWAYRELLAIPFTIGGAHDGGRRAQLVRIGLQKAMFSSPAAARQSVQARLKVLEQGPTTPDVGNEIEGLLRLDDRLEKIGPAEFTKYQQLLRLLKDPSYGWNRTAPDDRLVIFSERIETLRFLAEHLVTDLGCDAGAIRLLYGDMPDTEQTKLLDEFGMPESTVRVLVCSDVAAEGVNLHFLSHRLVHFDMPWSLMTFQQRNGRIDRYGQAKTPLISYLITTSENPKIHGDMRILEILQEKDEQAYKNIGDPSVFMGVYDPIKEEELTKAAMAEGMSDAEFDAAYQPKVDEGEDFLSLFLAPPSASVQIDVGDAARAAIASTPSLFTSDFAFFAQGLNVISPRADSLQFQVDETRRRITLTAPLDLQVRLHDLPREVWPEHGQFVLTDKADQMQREVSRCRQDESAWPKLHYLWPQHVAMAWLVDRVRMAFGRHSAPVLVLDAMQKGDIAFLMSGTIPNRKGQPLVVHRLAITYRNGKDVALEDLATFIGRTGLGTSPLVNRGAKPTLAEAALLLKTAVAAVREEVIRRRDEFDGSLRERLAAKMEELARLQERQYRQLELKLSESQQSETVKSHRRTQRTSEIDRVFKDYGAWIEDSMTTERDPYIQVLAAVIGAKE